MLVLWPATYIPSGLYELLPRPLHLYLCPIWRHACLRVSLAKEPPTCMLLIGTVAYKHALCNVDKVGQQASLELHRELSSEYPARSVQSQDSGFSTANSRVPSLGTINVLCTLYRSDGDGDSKPSYLVYARRMRRLGFIAPLQGDGDTDPAYT